MKRNLIYAGLFLVVGLLILPYVRWQTRSGQNLEVTILDKTVPDQSYREHNGVTWALNHFKYLKGDNSTYDLGEDYTGFHPFSDGQYEVTTLSDERAASSDLIYIADTYGVYENEYYGENLTEDRSDQIYGGLSLEDVTTLEREVHTNGTPVVAEFNSFASPTEETVKNRITSLLGIQWDGWIARYFSELDQEASDEIPRWMRDNYEQQEGQEWSFQGAGLIFLREDEVMVVLEEGEDFEGAGIRFDFTEKGQAFFSESLSSRYSYWFDVTVPVDAEVLAEYTLGLTEKGQERMNEYGISDEIPAVTRTVRSGTPMYYFAGDYADLETTPSFYEYAGLDRLYQLASRLQFRGAQSFYYRSYLPMMDKILQEAYDRRLTAMDDEGTDIDLYTENEITYSSRLNDSAFEIYRNGSWEPFKIQGVNMGIAKPGAWPGETAITFDEYARWLEQIAEMGANVLRVYTIHPPAFYQALWLHNQQSDSPLYLMHGIWINEEELVSSMDAYDPSNIEPFEREIRDAVDVIHGNAELEPKAGHASGEYVYDVSKYVLGYILGIEWDPLMVEATNEAHDDLAEFQGEYFSTQGANAFEKWLAERMEYISDYEVDRYNSMHPISFTNWPTTDLLEHPSEPLTEEDLVSVDPNSIYESDKLKTGYFASYHVYPYYPDFLNYDQDYLAFKDHRGQTNSYAGYLNELIGAHRMPVVIAEFGVPASRGMTHENPYGWNQGFLSEEEQGEIVVQLFEDIYAQGAAGGIMFTWQDEWFKRTWNTMELDDPDRRPYWSNVQTNEQRFGLLSFETHEKPVNGSEEEWDDVKQLDQKSTGLLRGFYADHDEAYLYLRVDYDPNEWNRETTINLLLDTIDDQGDKTVPFIEGAGFEQGIDFIAELSVDDESRLWVDNYYDPFYYQYGYSLGFLENNEKIEKNDGLFNKINLALSKEMVIPETGLRVPFQYYETGLLKEGIGDPESEAYDSLADYTFNEEKGILELRIPWLLINVKDPSQKKILGDLWSGGMNASAHIEGVDISVVSTEKGRRVDALPAQGEEQNEMLTYSWESWQEPGHEERLKKSYQIIQDYLTD